MDGLRLMPVSGHHCRRIGRQQVARSSQYLKHKHILPWLPSHDPAKNLPKLANPILSTRYFSARGSIRSRINWLKSSLSLSLSPFLASLMNWIHGTDENANVFVGTWKGKFVKFGENIASEKISLRFYFGEGEEGNRTRPIDARGPE